MPYNTRRKSLSLADLGVAIPKRSRTQSHPSPPSTIPEGDESERPKKISKTSHGTTSPTAGAMSPPKTTTIRIKEEKPNQQLSPPPSPGAAGGNKVDVEGISDDIVVATIQQLEETGNRPIFVRELAAVLANRLHSVEKYDSANNRLHRQHANILQRSANPSALISSRLTAYLNRSWPAISPCPLAKDLSPVHPRRLYFYLTTTRPQPVPESSEPIPKANRIISPSLSSASAADEEDEHYNRRRQALSPSPEVDLSSPELEDEVSQEPPTPGAPFSGRNSVARERSASASNLSHNRRAASPQLEHEERDFKQTANALYEQALQRRNSQQSQQDVSMEQADASAGAEQDDAAVEMATEESDESTALKNSEDAAALFGHAETVEQHMELFSSPVFGAENELQLDQVAMKPEKPSAPITLDLSHQQKDVASIVDWDMLQSPENVEMAELEDMFDAY